MTVTVSREKIGEQDGIQDCPAKIIVKVVDVSGEVEADLPFAAVRLVSPQTDKVTGDTGACEFPDVAAGERSIEVTRPLFYPKDTDNEKLTQEIKEQDGFQQVENGYEYTVKIEMVPIFSLWLDAERKGDAAQLVTEDLMTWNLGKTEAGGRGAIALCNSDWSAGTKTPGQLEDMPGNVNEDPVDTPTNPADNNDNKINGAADETDVAPLEVRQAVATAEDPVVTLELEQGNDQGRLRVFGGRKDGATEILGEAKGVVSDPLEFQEKKAELAMEAIRFDEKTTENDVVLLLRARHAGQEWTQKGKVRIAPWMMAHHLFDVTKVFVAKLESGKDGVATPLAQLEINDDMDDQEIAEVKARNQRDGTEENNNEDFRTALGGTLGGKLSTDLPYRGKWARDGMVFGFTAKPGSSQNVLMVRPENSRDMRGHVERFRTKGMGCFNVDWTYAANTRNRMGNLEVTPPTEAHPWGRIYYGTPDSGNGMNPKLIDFLKAQKVQAPFAVDTDWLDVGHVDELVTFVEDKTAGDGKWKMLVASPAKAIEILDDIQVPDPDNTTVLTGRRMGEMGAMSIEGVKFSRVYPSAVQQTVTEFRARPLDALGLHGQAPVVAQGGGDDGGDGAATIDFDEADDAEFADYAALRQNYGVPGVHQLADVTRESYEEAAMDYADGLRDIVWNSQNPVADGNERQQAQDYADKLFDKLNALGKQRFPDEEEDDDDGPATIDFDEADDPEFVDYAALRQKYGVPGVHQLADVTRDSYEEEAMDYTDGLRDLVWNSQNPVADGDERQQAQDYANKLFDKLDALAKEHFPDDDEEDNGGQGTDDEEEDDSDDEEEVFPPYPLRDINLGYADKITDLIGVFRDALDITDDDVIEIPVLFYEGEKGARAVTGNSVNMLVCDTDCFFAKPFGPVVGGEDKFEKAITDALTPLGLTGHAIDDWYPYHLKGGEVHCATNELRDVKLADMKWWEFDPDAV